MSKVTKERLKEELDFVISRLAILFLVTISHIILVLCGFDKKTLIIQVVLMLPFCIILILMGRYDKFYWREDE